MCAAGDAQLERVADAEDRGDLQLCARGGIFDDETTHRCLAALVDVACRVGFLAWRASAFLASTESFAHDYHKQRLIAAKAGETVHTDLFAINWPPNSPVRVLRNSVTDEAQAVPVTIVLNWRPASK